MGEKIKIGIVGYGNLGKGIEKLIKKSDDMELVAIFTRREENCLDCDKSKLKSISTIDNYKGKIDLMILCLGSANDLPIEGPVISKKFNTIDPFDTHEKIESYFCDMDKSCKENGTVSFISIGWDPGLFSLNRLLGEALILDGMTYTFWGKGVSQGHSEAIRKIKGVKRGIQYTIPNEKVLEKVREGKNPILSLEERHLRECFVVLENETESEKTRVEKEIKNMPNYFLGYKTKVNFISEEEFNKNHLEMKHSGKVIRTGETSNNVKHKLEFSLDLGSNPEFTGSIMLAYARALNRFVKEGKVGAFTIFDIPLSYILNKSEKYIRKNLL